MNAEHRSKGSQGENFTRFSPLTPLSSKTRGEAAPQSGDGSSGKGDAGRSPPAVSVRDEPCPTDYRSGTNARPLFGFIGITSWFAPAS
jgi:hypothetical protein